MSLSSCFRYGTQKQLSMVMCCCGKVAMMHTWWTDTNPKRQFWCFPKPVCNQFQFVFYSSIYLWVLIFLKFFLIFWKNSTCGFLAGFDPPMCVRAKDTVSVLLKSINKLCTSLGEMEDEVVPDKQLDFLHGCPCYVEIVCRCYGFVV